MGDVVPIDLCRTQPVEERGACLIITDTNIRKILSPVTDNFVVTVDIHKEE